jgi:uncharacterized protein DUF6152
MRLGGPMLWVPILLGVLWAGPAIAHHSFSGIFDVSKEMTIKGRISKIDWVNPHIYLYVDAANEQGKTITWALETLPPNWMRRAGITKADFLDGPDVGETVSVAAHPARDPEKMMGFILHITYPDGHILKFYDGPRVSK